jgi:hypothetical protein
MQALPSGVVYKFPTHYNQGTANNSAAPETHNYGRYSDQDVDYAD